MKTFEQTNTLYCFYHIFFLYIRLKKEMISEPVRSQRSKTGAQSSSKQCGSCYSCLGWVLGWRATLPLILCQRVSLALGWGWGRRRRLSQSGGEREREKLKVSAADSIEGNKKLKCLAISAKRVKTPVSTHLNVFRWSNSDTENLKLANVDCMYLKHADLHKKKVWAVCSVLPKL